MFNVDRWHSVLNEKNQKPLTIIWHLKRWRKVTSNWPSVNKRVRLTMKISHNSTSDKSSLVAKCLIILSIYQQEFEYLKYVDISIFSKSKYLINLYQIVFSPWKANGSFEMDYRFSSSAVLGWICRMYYPHLMYILFCTIGRWLWV